MPIPTLVALTTMSARVTSLTMPTEAAVASCAARSAFSSERFSTVMSLVPARPSASITERAAPPAPMIATRAASTSMPISAQRRHESGAVGARPDEDVAVPADRVDRLQRTCRRVEPIDRGGDVGLVRHRHRHATDAEHAHRLDRRRAVARCHVERGVRPVDARRRRSRHGGSPATGCVRPANRSARRAVTRARTRRNSDRPPAERSSTTRRRSADLARRDGLDGAEPPHSRPAAAAAALLASCCARWRRTRGCRPRCPST